MASFMGIVHHGVVATRLVINIKYNHQNLILKSVISFEDFLGLNVPNLAIKIPH